MIASLWASFAASKFGRWALKWCAIVGALLAALAIAFLKGRSEGEKTGAAKGEADAAQAKAEAAEHEAAVAASDQKAQQAAIDAASEVHDEVQKLPDAPAQQIGTADPHSAAGELLDDGWVRADADGADSHQ